ncbi:MAG: response regulator, partial [Hydrocarboniphaga effusa]|nr:response regulator [Hydrocarboniphaga effusa]
SARFALRKHLESHAFKVDTAESAQAAYQWLESQTPDMIFLDHVMPGEDGFTALRHLKADPHTAAIPVVICSSNEGNAFVAEARGQGAADVLQKPPTPEQLQRVLDQIESAIAITSTAEHAAAEPPAAVAEPAPAPTPASEPARQPVPVVAVAPAAPAAPQAPPAAAPPAPAVELAQVATEGVRAELTRLLEGETQATEALDARTAALESRMSAMERRLTADLNKLRKQQDARVQQHTEKLDVLRKQFDADLRAIHQQFAEELARTMQNARAQAVEEIRQTLIRALRGC